MTRRIASLVVAVAAVLALGQMAYADQTFSVHIPFPFVAGGQVHQAGHYDVRVFNDHFALMLVPDNAQANTLTVLARIAPDAVGGDDEARLVFQKIGNTHYLSEAWFEGYDGLMLQPAPGPADRTVVVTRGGTTSR
jgi:hypothetical protein